MRPINLVPSEIKRRRGRRDTGLAPYAIVGVLAAVAIGVLGYTVIGNQATSKRAEVAHLSRQIAKANARAADLAGYGKFAAMRQARVAGVTTVAAARFRWAQLLYEVSKALPRDAWLVEATGKVSDQAKTGEKGGGSPNPGSSSSGGEGEIEVPGPTLKLIGCTYRQRQLARMMTRLRNINGVAQVLLSSSDEKEENDASSEEGSSDDECRTRPGIHKFIVTLTFPPGPATQLVSSQTTADQSSAGQAAGGGQESSSGNGSKSPAESPKGADQAGSSTQATGAK